MITQKQIDTRDELITFLFDDVITGISYSDGVKYQILKQAIADADKEADEKDNGYQECITCGGTGTVFTVTDDGAQGEHACPQKCWMRSKQLHNAQPAYRSTKQ